MKKILFLTYVYPYGYYNASASCSAKIMSELAKDSDYEVHCVSYKQNTDKKQPYALDSKIILHPIELKEKKKRSKFRTHMQIVLRMPIYPIISPCRIWKHYKACEKICKRESFDLIVSQCFPEESVLVAALLKKKGVVQKTLNIFWDNIYGKKPARVIPFWFAKRRQKQMESFIAKYTNRMISLYPIKRYHDLYGDVSTAMGKRTYLGIPSMTLPAPPVPTKYTELIKKDMINILYSGTIIKPQFVFDLVEMLNMSKNIERVNLLFFCQGIDDKTKEQITKKFKGNISISGYIPLNELLSLYYQVDIFISFPGDTYSIRSKCYEYMSYGHPMVVFYDNIEDVNKATFSKYPLCLTQDVNRSVGQRANDFDMFIERTLGQQVPFSTVENLFLSDTPKAYVDFIKGML